MTACIFATQAPTSAAKGDVMILTITSGKEEYAFAMTAGDFLKMVELGRRAFASRPSADVVDFKNRKGSK